MESFAIHIGNFALSEPTTTISDFLLTLYCLLINLFLRRRRNGDAAMASWQFFFAGMGLSFLAGVFVHGLRHYQTEEAHYNTWMVMNVITGCSVYFAQIATSRSILKGGRGELLMRTTANVQFILYLVCIYLFHSFNAVKIQIAVAMVPVMLINFFDYRKGTKGGAWLGVGIGISFFSAVFHTLKLSISERWFNYNDISHLFLAGSFTMMIMGISRRMNGAEATEEEGIISPP